MASTFDDRSWEEPLVAHLRAGKKVLRTVAWLALGTAVLPWLGWRFAGLRLIGVLGFTGVLVLLAAAFWAASLGDPRRHPALAALRERPGEVVWVYVETATRHGQAVGARVELGLASGKRLALPAELGREQELLALVARRAPLAAVGFDPERARTFRRDPRALRRVA